VYYDLTQARDERKLSDTVAICRVEQILSFPYDLAKEECAKYHKASIIWAREEPKNQGAWSYVQPRFKTVLKDSKSIGYAGRSAAASPVTGNKMQHATVIVRGVRLIIKFSDSRFSYVIYKRSEIKYCTAFCF